MVNIIIFSPSYFGALISRKINFPVETLRTPDVPQEKSQQIISMAGGRLNAACAYFITPLGLERAETATNPGRSCYLSSN